MWGFLKYSPFFSSHPSIPLIIDQHGRLSIAHAAVFLFVWLDCGFCFEPIHFEHVVTQNKSQKRCKSCKTSQRITFYFFFLCFAGIRGPNSVNSDNWTKWVHTSIICHGLTVRATTSYSLAYLPRPNPCREKQDASTDNLGAREPFF